MVPSPIKKQITIFNYNNYIEYLKDFCDAYLSEEGASYRNLSKLCGINSSSYFQKVLSRERNITLNTARKICQGFGFDETEMEYFLLLVALSRTSHTRNAESALHRLEQLRNKVSRKKIDDANIFSHWSYGLLVEIIGMKSPAEESDIVALMKKFLSESDTIAALRFLESKRYIIREGEAYSLSKDDISFETHDDVKRMIDVQKNHLFYLDQAKFRLIDNLSNREFQGLTIAIPSGKFKRVKEVLRKTINDLNEEFSTEKDCDSIIQVEICSYFLFNEQECKEK